MIEFLLSKLACVAILLPILIIFMINYFVYNLGSDSFSLGAPSKYTKESNILCDVVFKIEMF